MIESWKKSASQIVQDLHVRSDKKSCMSKILSALVRSDVCVFDLGSGGYLTSTELYDPSTEVWSLTGSMTTGRYGHTASVLQNGKVLVTGGQGSSSSYLTTAELYQP